MKIKKIHTKCLLKDKDQRINEIYQNFNVHKIVTSTYRRGKQEHVSIYAEVEKKPPKITTDDVNNLYDGFFINS